MKELHLLYKRSTGKMVYINNLEYVLLLDNINDDEISKSFVVVDIEYFNWLEEFAEECIMMLKELNIEL